MNCKSYADCLTFAKANKLVRPCAPETDEDAEQCGFLI